MSASTALSMIQKEAQGGATLVVQLLGKYVLVRQARCTVQHRANDIHPTSSTLSLFAHGYNKIMTKLTASM